MRDWKLPWRGGCRCDRIRIKVSAPPLLASACHCRGCQKMSASAFSLSIAIPAEGFEVTQGEPVVGGLQGATRHYFCGFCKSWMFTRPEGMDMFVNVRPSTLYDHSWFVPYVEVFTDEKLPWAATPAVRSFATQPEMADWQTFIGEFAERGAGPA